MVWGDRRAPQCRSLVTRARELRVRSCSAIWRVLGPARVVFAVPAARRLVWQQPGHGRPPVARRLPLPRRRTLARTVHRRGRVPSRCGSPSCGRRTRPWPVALGSGRRPVGTRRAVRPGRDAAGRWSQARGPCRSLFRVSLGCWLDQHNGWWLLVWLLHTHRDAHPDPPGSLIVKAPGVGKRPTPDRAHRAQPRPSSARWLPAPTPGAAQDHERERREWGGWTWQLFWQSRRSRAPVNAAPCRNRYCSTS